MKARRLKMRKDVWTRTLFSGSQWGVYMGRQVMYYLESDLPLCLIRAWLREAVTAGFSPCVRMSAQEWRWTCDHCGELDQYSHTLNVKCRKCITLCCHVHWRGRVIRVFRKHYSSLYWPAMGWLQSLGFEAHHCDVSRPQGAVFYPIPNWSRNSKQCALPLLSKQAIADMLFKSLAAPIRNRSTLLTEQGLTLLWCWWSNYSNPKWNISLV